MLKNIVVPVSVVSILGTMVVPLPPVLLDLLLVGNLVLALLLFASTFYIVEPLKLSSLPTLLLLATLFRLALNISTTRLILGSGEAGATIEAFGSIVVGGNLVVGLVIFLLITLVQFLVIAKGSERVAEVSARFTLDALPGKQMSIDADVRAGLIDFETARQKRSDLQLESRFYGALDGAMKFVKGDAVAGLVITAVNILGGFATGIFLEGLDLSSAVAKYTLLTVGDGLVSQVPALLNAVAAGMVVTRVGSGEGAPLATELLSQLGQLRGVKCLVGVVALVLGLCPGMPFLPFALFAGLLFAASALGRRGPDRMANVTQEFRFLPKLHPLLGVELGREFAHKVFDRGDTAEMLEQFRQSEFDRTGIILLRPDVTISDSLGAIARIRTRGVPVLDVQIPADCPASVALTTALRGVSEERREELVDDIMTRRLLDRLDGEAPELVAGVVPGIVSVTQLTEILRALRRERVTVRNLDVILQAVSEHGARVANERVLLEEVRIALRRVIAWSRCEGEALPVATLDPFTELAFERWELEGTEPEPEFIDQCVDCLNTLTDRETTLVVSRKARARVAETVRERGLPFGVLAHEEIPPDMKLSDRGAIRIPGSEHIVERLAA